MKKFRDQGAAGALLDEYERALKDLKDLVSELTPNELAQIVDLDTKDPDCKSIQTILTHVLRSGYGYVNAIRKNLGETDFDSKKHKQNNAEEYLLALDTMFQYTEQLFKDYPNLKLVEKDSSKKILTAWGQRFDADQLLEHAIVHILRHRRQIERFLLKMSA